MKKQTNKLIFTFFIILMGGFAFAQNMKEVNSLLTKADALEYEKPDSAIYFYNKVITLLNKNLKNPRVGHAYLQLQSIYFSKSQYPKTIENSLNALKSAEINKDIPAQIICNITLNTVFYRQNNFKTSIKYGMNVVHLAEQIRDTLHIIRGLNNISDVISSEGLHDSSISVLSRALKLSVASKDKYDYANLHDNMANAYYNKATNTSNRKDYLMASRYVAKGINWLENSKREKEDDADLAYANGLNGAINLALGNYNIAEKSYQKAIKIFYDQKDVFNLLLVYNEVTEVYLKMNNSKKAFLSFKSYDSLSKKNNIEINNQSITDMQTKYETEKKEKENKLLQTQNQLSTETIKQQKIISYFIITALLLVIGLAFFIFSVLKNQRKANKIISIQKQEVESQKNLVEEHRKEILDSIHYARRIQAALLGNKELIQSYFPQNFIFFQPKDIVSGDFFWATEHDNKFYLAICDSTGHGVPGAFMSLLNMGFLSEAIKEKNIKNPNEVFDYVRSRLVNSISKEGQDDGMDGILICFDKAENRLTYAAANNVPIVIKNKTIVELSKDRMPVGEGILKKSFELFTIDIKAGETLYLYTDGFADQFGGTNGKKFKYKQLNNLLLEISDKPLPAQNAILNKRLETWKGNLEQVDDICIVGIRM